MIAAQLRVLALYPERMNIYADRGNLLLLERRCAMRGIGFELAAASVGASFDPAAHDLVYIGGGQDRDQEAIAGDMVETKGEPLRAAIDDGRVVLAVCGGYQLLGRSYQIGDREIPGLDLVGLTTVREAGPRLIGNVIVEVETPSGPRELAGFENHGGRTYLDDPRQALGRVICGYGNNGHDDLEGVRVNNLFGTYLHGPLLPKNAWFADLLTALALGGRDAGDLAPLDDTLERSAHECARRVALADARPGVAARARRKLAAVLERSGR
jgi:CobQ-like glutamine amidotransferase family enzyme